ncbi:aldo-keto reductase-like protein [Lasiosphaeris hirsuta]|uniref:Aldo-keto reductase-like protein n=1 Tax=Lasiosphaeris hirsuta TaxID=260670 RepID=A0AA40B0U5_9PEZI|nr:aldo-keto reductase-like protein [Lasiosphaeris hirsuta]
MPKRKHAEISQSSLSLTSKVRLNSGYEIPLLGFGVWLIPANETELACATALTAGYRHIDTAVAYKNENACGAAIAAAIKAGTVAREDIFFASKVPTPAGISYEGAKKYVQNSLAKSGLEYIDLILLHAPFGGSKGRKGAWKALVEAVEEGHVRSIGVSNYGIPHLDQLEQHIKELEAERGGKPGAGGVLSVGQWEVHPWCARPEIVDWCRKRGVVVEAYSPLARGTRFKDKGLKEVAKKYGKTPAQVLIRWSLQKGLVPLPKSNKKLRIKANADVFDFELEEEEMEGLESDEYKPTYWDPTVSSLEEMMP